MWLIFHHLILKLWKIVEYLFKIKASSGKRQNYFRAIDFDIFEMFAFIFQISSKCINVYGGIAERHTIKFFSFFSDTERTDEKRWLHWYRILSIAQRFAYFSSSLVLIPRCRNRNKKLVYPQKKKKESLRMLLSGRFLWKPFWRHSISFILYAFT